MNINGQIVSPEAATVSIFDRGFLYGDSVYEVIRTYDGYTFALEEHLSRLKRSAQALYIPLSLSEDELKERIFSTLRAAHTEHPSEDLYVRAIITRGVGNLGFAQSKVQGGNTVVIFTLPLSALGRPADQGISLWVAEDRIRMPKNALDPAIKSGNYLNCVLAYLEAQQHGADDALLCDTQGNVTEGTTFNIFAIQGSKVLTPRKEVGILDGITRSLLMQWLREEGLTVEERDFSRQDLLQMEELFITGTIKEVCPVTLLNGTPVGSGSPGPWTQRIRKLYQIRARDHARNTGVHL